jgi:hypothetical protein
MKWSAHRDWAGWSFGWYPTHDDDRQLTLQKINWFCINLDIGETRVSLTYRRNSMEEAYRRARGLPPKPRLMIER